MKYVFLGIFVIFTAIHLYASKKKNQNLRNFSKGFILLSLMAYYTLSTSPIWVTLIALIFSWLGDIFLIPKGLGWFTAGGILFLISHAFFIISYSYTIDFPNLSLFLIIPVSIIFFVIVSFIMIKLKPYLHKALVIPMGLYLLINGTMNSFAIFRFASNINIGTILTLVGAILFFISDTTLYFVRFKKDSKLKTHFLVMLTYTLAEFLIVEGLILG